MSTPTLQQARSHYEAQRRIVALAILAIRRLFAQNRPLTEVVATASAYQLAAATASAQTVAAWSGAPQPLTVPSAFAGVSSYGFALSEPIIATIDRFVEAPVEPLPANWWSDAQVFMASIEQLIASEVQDAGRTASQVEMTGHGWTEYVRLLNPPSCARCAVLAGRVYRYSQGFDRHPLCDCVMVPVENEDAAKAEGLIADPMVAFEKGLLRTRVSKDSDEYRSAFSKADEQAIRDGADITEIVNATRGTSQPGITNALTTEMFGRSVKATTYGTTKRAAWRKANPTRLVRLRPETIYQIAENREDAIRLLRLYGYIR